MFTYIRFITSKKNWHHFSSSRVNTFGIIMRIAWRTYSNVAIIETNCDHVWVGGVNVKAHHLDIVKILMPRKFCVKESLGRYYVNICFLVIKKSQSFGDALARYTSQNLILKKYFGNSHLKYTLHSEGRQKPNLLFGVLKRVKSGLKWLKMTKNLDKIVFSGKKPNRGEGVPKGVWLKTRLFPNFFAPFP